MPLMINSLKSQYLSRLFKISGTFINLSFRHDIKKQNELIDYEKFLTIFQDQSSNSISKSYSALSFSDNSLSAINPMKSAEKRLVEFFHGASFLCYNSFK